MGDWNAGLMVIIGLVAVFALIGAVRTYGIPGIGLAVAFIVAGAVVAGAWWIGALDWLTEALR